MKKITCIFTFLVAINCFATSVCIVSLRPVPGGNDEIITNCDMHPGEVIFAKTQHWDMSDITPVLLGLVQQQGYKIVTQSERSWTLVKQ